MGAIAKAAKKRDMETVFLRVTPTGLVPHSAFDAEEVGKYKIGSVVEATLHAPQSEKQHRLLRWAMSIVADNTDAFPNGAALMFAVKVRLGFFHSISLGPLGQGALIHVRSLSELDGPALNEFFDRAMVVLRDQVIPGLDTRTLILEGRVAVGGAPLCLPKPSSAD